MIVIVIHLLFLSLVKMAATVVRVKRLLEEEPLEAVIINCKRRKTEQIESSCEPVAAVLNFAGTVDDQVMLPNKFEHNLTYLASFRIVILPNISQNLRD